MTTIAVEPIVLKSSLFTVGTDDYQKATSTVEFVPSPVSQNFDGLGDNHVVIAGKTKWMANVSFAQDWSTPNSLSRYLFTHQGEVIDVLFQPVDGVGDTFAASVLIQPGSIGGKVDSIAETTVSMPVSGQVTIVTP